MAAPGRGREVDAETKRHLLREYSHGQRGRGYAALGRKYGLSKATVQSVVNKANGGVGEVEAARRGRKRKLSEVEERKILRAADANPAITNSELAALVDNKVAARTVGDILARADPPFRKRRLIDREPREYKPEWKDEMQLFVRNTLHRLPIDRRVYADETGIHTNAALTFGRVRRGREPYRPNSRYGQKFTLHVYAKRTGVVLWALERHNCNNEDLVSFAQQLAEEWEEGDVLLWDRLGRSGRARNSVKLHYNPEVKETIEQVGCRVVMLPPLAKYLNPIELLFADLKQHYLKPARSAQGQNLTFEDIEAVVEEYMNDVAPRVLPGFFSKRANGREGRERGLF